MQKLLGFLGVIVLSGCSIYPEEWFDGGKNRFSPWHGFVYVMEQPNVEVRTYQGEYLTLTRCMENMQLRTKFNGYGYFCGFNCDDPKNPYKALKCEKVMGSSLEALN